jgi:hypothetical protein
MDTEKLRKQIASGEFKLKDSTKVIKEGILSSKVENTVNFQILHGWNIISAISCDKTWGKFTIEMLEHIDNQNYSEEQLQEVLDQLYLEDYHWDWFTKARAFSSDEYEWFFLFAEEQVQGACLIYHPKPSAIDSKQIFYIEYVAVAPWNRENPIAPKQFSGVGTQLINCALDYSINILGLEYGFSLHSLPKATGYYIKLGMVNFESRNKESLVYFEMPRETARKLLETS